MSLITPFNQLTEGKPIRARRVKLPNRRVTIYRMQDGGSVLVFRALRGWKQISEIVVPLSMEGTEATLRMLMETQKGLSYEGQTIKV